jgi:hypothetical protein
MTIVPRHRCNAKHWAPVISAPVDLRSKSDRAAPGQTVMISDSGRRMPFRGLFRNPRFAGYRRVVLGGASALLFLAEMGTSGEARPAASQWLDADPLPNP